MNNSRVLVITGSDSLGVEKQKEQFLESIYTNNGSFTEEFYDSSREQLNSFLNRLITPSIFEETRLFHIKHIQKLTNDELKDIRDIINQNISSVYILLEYENDKTKKVSKYLELTKLKKLDYVSVVNLSKPKKYEMPKWLIGQVKQLTGRDINLEAAQHLLEYVSFELDLVYSELQKIDIYLPEGAPITVDAVLTVTGSGKDLSPSDFCNAVGHRTWATAYDCIEYLLGDGGSNIMLLVNALFRHFWLLYKIRTFASENRDLANKYFKARYKEKSEVAATIMIAIGFLSETTKNRVYPAVVLPKVIEQATKYSDKEIIMAISNIVTYDRDIKSGTVSMSIDSFLDLVYSIIRKNSTVYA